MRKTILMSAMMAASTAFAAHASAEVTADLVEVSLQEERIQIKPDDLPDPVKQTVAGDETVRAFPVAEAWQFKDASGKITYKVGFDNGTASKFWKTYDPQGKEIKE